LPGGTTPNALMYTPGNNLPMVADNNNHNPIVLNENNKPLEVEETYSLADMEKQLIAKVMRKHKFRRKSAAQELGISERTLYRKMQEYNIADKN
jgi:DNA-binding NtrC family response regulator